MSILLKIYPEPGFLKVVAMGKFSLQEAKRTFVEMLESVAMHKAKEVLVDGRKLMGNPRTIERFFYSEFAVKTLASFADRGVSRPTQFAYVLKEPMLDPERFGETVAVNRGIYGKAFDNFEDALEWLGISSSNKFKTGDSK